MRVALPLPRIGLPVGVGAWLRRLLLAGVVLVVVPLARLDTAVDLVQPVVSTVAGVGRAGYRDGPTYGAYFWAPTALVFGRDGTLYIADSTRIRRLTPGGDVSTFVGSDQAGFVDDLRGDARFGSELGGLAIGPNGELYVADASNHAIRRISPDGRVATIAGTGTAGYRDGPAAPARFEQPYGLTADANGNLYITELVGARIRKLARDGRVNTLAGTGRVGYRDGPGPAALFVAPSGITIGPAGQLYLT